MSRVITFAPADDPKVNALDRPKLLALASVGDERMAWLATDGEVFFYGCNPTVAEINLILDEFNRVWRLRNQTGPWPQGKPPEAHDAVNHPSHYTSHPSGVECIEIIEHFVTNIGNAIKYLWRAGLKDDLLQDLEKARWYIDREIERVKKRNQVRG